MSDLASAIFRPAGPLSCVREEGETRVRLARFLYYGGLLSVGQLTIRPAFSVNLSDYLFFAALAVAFPLLFSQRLGGGDLPRGVLCGSYLFCLGLLSKGNRDHVTTRSFEVPALGTLLCAERTDEHLELYKDREEAVFWRDAKECAEQCKALLANDSLREAIAKAGHERCLRNAHFNEVLAASEKSNTQFYLHYYGTSQNTFERASLVNQVDVLKSGADRMGRVGAEDLHLAWQRTLPRALNPEEQVGFNQGDWRRGVLGGQRSGARLAAMTGPGEFAWLHILYVGEATCTLSAPFQEPTL